MEYIIDDIERLATAAGDERVRLMRRIAVNIGNEEALRRLLGIDPAEFAAFYPDLTPPELSTEDTIDSFIDRYAPGAGLSPGPASDPAPDPAPGVEIPVAPAADYAAAYMDMKEADANDREGLSDDTSATIDAFLTGRKADTNRKEAPTASAQPPKTAPGPVGTHVNASANATRPKGAPEISIAEFKRLVRERQYERALQTIKQLHLANPEKNIYFAHQTRFLETLIRHQTARIRSF